MFDIEEAEKQNQNQISRIAEIEKSINVSEIESEIKNLEKETERQDFWNDTENSKIVLSKVSDLKKKIENYKNVEKDVYTKLKRN